MASRKLDGRRSEVDAQVRRLHAAGWSDHRIGRRLGVKHTSVWWRRKRLGLPSLYPKGPGTRPAPTRADAEALAAAGWRWPDPALPPGVSSVALRYLLALLDGPLTARQAARAVGGRDGLRSPSLLRLRRLGLVTTAPGTVRDRRGNTPFVYLLTPEALDLISNIRKEAARG